MEKRDKLLWYWISKKEELGQRTIKKLIDKFQSIERIYEAKTNELEEFHLKEEILSYLMKKVSVHELAEEMEKMKQRGIYFVSMDEEEYPSRLKKLYDAPWFLYYRGELPKEEMPSVAIIGARNCTVYGSDVSYYFAKELSEHGVQIISGLARGIDGMAHQGAVASNGKTYGVIGNGVDLCYPRENYELYQKVVGAGGILSEYPLGSKALPYHFPLRNRLIAGLSDGILVIEAKEKSGTLITVDSGLEQGKDIYAIPGKIKDEFSKGCNCLIQNGAKLVLSPEDILVELRDRYPAILRWNEKSNYILKEGLTEEEQKVYALLSYQAVHIEELMEQTKLSQGQLLETLFDLECKQYARMISAQHYIKNF